MKATEDITSGPIAKTIMSLAIPVVMGSFMEIALTVVNFFWVGKLGKVAQDAITSSMVVNWTVFSSIAIVTIGLSAVVSRRIGEKEPRQASEASQQGMWLALILGLVITVAGFILTPHLLTFMEAGPETQKHAIPYLKIFFVSATLFALYDSGCATFRAAGNTRTPLLVGSSMIALNLVLDPLLIFGIGPFPKLGVPGASVATTISIFLACCILLYLLRRGRAGFPVERIFALRPKIEEMLKIARIGLPITIQALTFIVVYWFLIRIVHQYGEAAGAAMGIGNRMESISYLTCSGFAIAASTMVGQNLGARQPDRAARCAWGAAGFAVAITCVIGAIFIVAPHWITGIFTSDYEVHKIASDYLIILGLSQFTMAIEIVLEGSFSGAGDTIAPMVVLIPGAVMRVPLAYWLCFHLNWGINGVWWTLTITTTIKASVLAFWFSRGRWKHKKI
ncbi:hypothetical protein C3F09_01425 [candidate division GN15 bacterium]|uniref:Multidrug-efflux transporter n=1 Tax=candidate division GN15 bacterium TaxID=2072418 RepID=A0A855X451_9BACT|nr:MAG: hypothetical protein C3F09_01425 [candidate division GN15 bacterium]